jgi:hypothetical protein
LRVSFKTSARRVSPSYSVKGAGSEGEKGRDILFPLFSFIRALLELGFLALLLKV